MSISMLKMYISFAGMIFLFLAMGLIYVSRRFLKGWFGALISIIAYICLFAGGIIILYVVFTGPTR